MATIDKKFLAKCQREFADQVNIPPKESGYVPQYRDVILALDIQYDGEEAHVAGSLHYWKESSLCTVAGVVSIDVPYIPGYFCFREGPPLLSLIQNLQQDSSYPAVDLIIVDGHGLAHPRRFGVACWLGIFTKKPTIGCAKDTLIHYDGEPGNARGDKVEVFLDGELVGFVLRRQKNIRPVFVSPGHLVDVESCASIVLDLPGEFRIPDPIRFADQVARAHCKGIKEETWKDLGTLSPVKINELK